MPIRSPSATGVTLILVVLALGWSGGPAHATPQAVRESVGPGGVVVETREPVAAPARGAARPGLVADRGRTSEPLHSRPAPPQAGWPVANGTGMESGFNGSPTVADLDLDGDLELLVGSRDGRSMRGTRTARSWMDFP